MNIQAFSKLTSVSPHTIRYYEKSGLLRSVQRSSSGHRVFYQSDVEWMAFIQCLKEVGMPLEQIVEYARLREQGEETFAQRQAMLEAHIPILQTRIAEQQQHLDKLLLKIEYYKHHSPD